MTDSVPIGIDVADLRPTQMTVGLREVELKRRQWREATSKGRTRLLRQHVIPVVIGPKKRPYAVDHHHFARALLEEEAGLVATYTLADLSHLSRDEFWVHLDNSAWCHAYDAQGRRRKLAKIPPRLGDLADDPYRSLAGALIRSGGCAKSPRPFAEFLWADFLRRRIASGLVERDYKAAVKAALELCRGEEARSLPGWCGGEPAGL